MQPDQISTTIVTSDLDRRKKTPGKTAVHIALRELHEVCKEGVEVPDTVKEEVQQALQSMIDNIKTHLTKSGYYMKFPQ